MSLRLAAIYTTYKPDAGFRSRIEGIVSRCHATIVVDNTPGSHVFEDASDLTLLQDGVNKFLEPMAGAVLAKIAILVFIIVFIQKRPQGLFAMKGRSAE